MGYKWKPSKAQRREFAIRMANDEEYRNAYYKRKEEREAKRRESSKFDYKTAGGEYIPTKAQYNAAFQFLYNNDLSEEESDACNMVVNGYICNMKVHHDFIHIVNELIRNKKIINY
ncbi:MAG TPA: hypothetical protein P5301_07285 [Bacteroidales bacterium]|jgi:hypothetical protein|nr:hypothetical protein [Bacteroidales bacterium]